MSPYFSISYVFGFDRRLSEFFDFVFEVIIEIPKQIGFVNQNGTTYSPIEVDMFIILGKRVEIDVGTSQINSG